MPERRLSAMWTGVDLYIAPRPVKPDITRPSLRLRGEDQARQGVDIVPTQLTHLPKPKFAKSPSAEVCRVQEGLHLERAANASLENVRNISAKAAAAWHLEALRADDREGRTVKTGPVARYIAPTEPLADVHDERWLSENPDRGHANA